MRVRRDAGVSTDFACARLRSRLAADRIASPSMYPYSKCLLRRPTYYRCGAYRYTGRSIAATRTCYLYSMRWVLGHNVLSLNAYLSESYSTSRTPLVQTDRLLCAQRVCCAVPMSLLIICPMYVGPCRARRSPPASARNANRNRESHGFPFLGFPLRRAARAAGFIPAKMAEKSFLRRLVSRVDGAPRALN